MPLASLRCRSARFDDERLNQKVKIATLKNISVTSEKVVLNRDLPRFIRKLLYHENVKYIRFYASWERRNVWEIQILLLFLYDSYFKKIKKINNAFVTLLLLPQVFEHRLVAQQELLRAIVQAPISRSIDSD